MLSFDVGRPQFRFDAHPEYKAGRPSMPDDLRSQFPIVREIAQMMNIPIRELEGYEADDVIGSLVQHGKRAGVDTYIVSGDLDGLQLVNDHVRLLTTRMGVAATVIYDEAKVMTTSSCGRRLLACRATKTIPATMSAISRPKAR